MISHASAPVPQTSDVRALELGDVLDGPEEFIGKEITISGELSAVDTIYSARGLLGVLGSCDRFPRLRLADGNGRTLSCPYSREGEIDAGLVNSRVAVTGVLVKQSFVDWIVGNIPIVWYFTSGEDRLYFRTQSMTISSPG